MSCVTAHIPRLAGQTSAVPQAEHWRQQRHVESQVADMGSELGFEVAARLVWASLVSKAHRGLRPGEHVHNDEHQGL
mgnify:CR=1 FL=1